MGCVIDVYRVREIGRWKGGMGRDRGKEKRGVGGLRIWVFWVFWVFSGCVSR